jgi:uncharacterized protein YoxC
MEIMAMLLANMAIRSTAVQGLVGPAHGISLSALALQVQTEPVAVSHLNETILMWFVIIAAVALMIQAIMMAVLAIGGLKIAKDLMKIVEEVKGKALPLVDTTRTLVTDLTPQIKQITNKVEVIAAHVESISGVAAEKVHEFSPTVSAARETVEQANQTVRDANHKTQQQIVRVNEMITGVLDATSRAGAKLQRGISIPGREAAGLVSGLKATYEYLVGNAKHFDEDRPLGGKRTSSTQAGSPYRTEATPSHPTADETVRKPETRESGR